MDADSSMKRRLAAILAADIAHSLGVGAMVQTRSALMLSIILGLALVSWEAHAQQAAPPAGGPGGSMSPAAFVGVLPTVGTVGPQGSQPGVLAGSLPPDAKVGALAGSLPPDATVGALTPADATDGSRIGALPPGAERPTPEGVERQAEVYLRKGAFGNADERLQRALAVQQESVGPEHSDVAQTLDRQAAMVRRWGREAAAQEMEGRAKEMRGKLEPKGQGAIQPSGLGVGLGGAPGVLGAARP